MKFTSILAYSAAASLTALLLSLIATQDPSLGYAALATSMVALIAVQDYAPRSYFVVTSQSPLPTIGRKPGAAFSPSLRRSLPNARKGRLSVGASLTLGSTSLTRYFHPRDQRA